jgi:AcrR family transcriptional regulator
MDNKKNRKTVRSKALLIAKPEKVNGFTRRKEQSKDDIRKAAIELFSQFGIEKVNISDIARKAGVAQATIYNNFGSKDIYVFIS